MGEVEFKMSADFNSNEHRHHFGQRSYFPLDIGLVLYIIICCTSNRFHIKVINSIGKSTDLPLTDIDCRSGLFYFEHGGKVALRG